MNPEDKKEIIQIFNEGFEKIILPQIVSINTRLDGIDIRLDRIEDKLDDHGNRLARIEVRLENHSHRLGRIEGKLDAVVDEQDRQSVEISALKDKLA